jgi:hypothetical protein
MFHPQRQTPFGTHPLEETEGGGTSTLEGWNAQEKRTRLRSQTTLKMTALVQDQ